MNVYGRASSREKISIIALSPMRLASALSLRTTIISATLDPTLLAYSLTLADPSLFLNMEDEVKQLVEMVRGRDQLTEVDTNATAG